MSTVNDVSDRYHTYLTLRKKYPVFVYHGWDMEPREARLKITYRFEIEGLAKFAPSWIFPITAHNPVQTTAFHNAVFYLGMVELISYWKLCCCPKVLIKGRKLSEDEIRWWKHLYFNGLGEFYYRNHILQSDELLHADSMMEILSEEVPATQGLSYDSGNLNGCLIPIGGGKDSAVSLELLRDSGMEESCYIINPRGATLDTARVFGFEQKHIFTVDRSLCPEMLRLNKLGYLNGHTPFSAIVAFSSVIAAMLDNKKYIVLSNEDSANESTVVGSHVNHQYSKSFEFERDFIRFEQTYIGSGTSYFSLLRPLCELQIAKLFSKKCKAYFPIFRSCNVGSKDNIWCGSCSKCLFVYLMLAPFLKREELIGIFGKDLSNDEKMLSDFERLIGLTAEKPFECVGSVDEVHTAIHMTLERLLGKEEPLPFLYQRYLDKGLFSMLYDKDRHLKHFNSIHALPEVFKAILLDHMSELAHKA